MIANYADATSLAAGLILPAIVAMFTRPSTNSTVKGTVHALLAAATGFAAVYQGDPKNFTWAPAVIATFLAWLTGTAFYHSLLKKYGWFQWLQNALVREAKTLHTGFVADGVFDFAQVLEAEESGPSNNFPLSTDEATDQPQETAPEQPVVDQPVAATVQGTV
jgi:hypothetical protein